MTPMSSAQRGQQGFTLIEVIIAMTLAALVSTLGAGILRMGVDYYQRAQEHTRQQQEIRGFLRLIRQELQGASKGAVVVTGREDQLFYSTDSVPVGANRRGLKRINLQCRENAPGKIELVHRIEIKPPAASNAGSSGVAEQGIYEEEVLVHELTQCHFAFLLSEKPKDKAPTVGHWSEEFREGVDKPLALRIRLRTVKSELPAVVISLQ